MQDYVELREGGYYVAGTRISLDVVVDRFNAGASPESILKSFPRIGSLERVHGAITFYLANKDSVEAYLSEQDRLTGDVSAYETALPQSLAEKIQRAKAGALPQSS